MSVPTEKILEVARFVRTKYARMGMCGADLDDVEQQAALAALETAKRYRPRPGVNPFAWLVTAALRTTSLEGARWRHPLSFSERARNEGRIAKDLILVRLDRRRSTEKGPTAGPFEIPDERTPDKALEALEAARESTRASVQFRRRTEIAMAAFVGENRRAAEMLLGLDGEGAEPKEVVWRTGMSWPAVRALAAAIASRLGSDEEARRIRGVISATG